MKNNILDRLLKNVWFYVLTLFALLLLLASFLLPPTGIIDPSVLAATGEIFAFASLGTVIKAIDDGTHARLNKGDVSIEVMDANKNKAE